eukprot:2951270-Pyramimonas_sp.AAC.1
MAGFPMLGMPVDKWPQPVPTRVSFWPWSTSTPAHCPPSTRRPVRAPAGDRAWRSLPNENNRDGDSASHPSPRSRATCPRASWQSHRRRRPWIG